MKKTRKILSIVLAILFAFSSMPVVYTGTAAADAVTYAVEETGTLENPTKPVEASGAINQTDLYKLNINSQSTSYTFYQTKNDEYFTFGQTQGLQHYYDGTSTGGRTMTFESIEFYVGGSGMGGSTEPKEISSGFGMWESPLITNNPTVEYLSKYHVSSAWSSTNSNAQGLKEKPENITLDGGMFDVRGCKVYTWNDQVVFHGHSASESGQLNTGYYEQLKWNWVRGSESARFDLRIGTILTVLDARELAKEIAKAEDIINNPGDYEKSYVSSVEATLNTIPDDLRNFSKVYSQSEIDRYTQMLKDVSLNSADYTEFNQLYKNLKGITNAKDVYTEVSFNAFKAEIAQINANLPKNLDKTKQSTVDAATQALRDAFNKLVATDLSDNEDSYYFEGTDNSGNVNITVKNVNLKFMQTRENQEFEFTQKWTLQRTGGSNKRIIYRVTLDESLPLYCGGTSCQSNPNLTENKTSDFISRMNSGYTTRTADDADGNSFSAKEFTCWASDEVEDPNAQNKKYLVNNGIIGGEFGLSEKTYNATLSPRFRGNTGNETGEISTNFVQRIGYEYYTGVFQYKYRHFHINTTVKVTDVRQLISAVADAKNTIANPGTHSDSYITALKAAVDSVPVEMLRGVEYFTQAEVDKLYNDITTIPENVADYSDFVETFEWMLAENKDKYTEDSYNVFISEIYSINQNLPKNLTADQQSIIDEAVYALYAAHDKLVSVHLNSDNVITQEDIDGISDIDTNNPLAFTLASTQYNFMQVADGQKFAIRTEFTARNSKARYTCQLLSLRFSAVTADTIGTICEGRATPDTGCHNGDKVTLNQGDIVVPAVEGVKIYDTINDAGDFAEYNTWVNTKGVALSTNGILNDPTTLSTSDSSAYAEMYYTGSTGDQEANSGAVDVTFAYRLGWQYYEQVLGFNGTTIKRHAHIPVNIKITDARALNSLYEETDAILKGKTDENYTFNSLINLYEAFNKVDPDMAYGSEYFTQEQVDAAYADLKGAYGELVPGADYSEYFKAYVKAEEIMNSGNKDSRGNKLYDEEVYNSFVENVTNIENNLPKDLVATEDNQKRIDDATKGILDALTALEATKRADYSELNDAMTKAEKILNAPEGTYTDKTVEAVQNAYNNAVALDKNLPASEQTQVDSVTSALEAAIADKEYKADYSEYEDAKNTADSITNNDGTYTDSAYQEYLDKIADIDSKLSKDLPDTAENRQTIADSTQALEDAMAELENNKKADYTEFDKAVEELENIVENPDVYTEETIKAAEDALDKAKQNDDLTSDKQTTVDSITEEMNQVITNAQKNPADYTDYNNAKAEADAIINKGNAYENGDPIYDETAFEQYKQAIENIDSSLPKDLTVDNQSTVDGATSSLEDLKATLEETKKADYTKFNEAKDALQEIVDNPDDYTSASVEAAQKALDEADKVPAGLPVGKDNVYQDMIDNATDAMNQVLDSIEKKADYTEFDKVVDELENIVNNPDKFTDETVQAAKDALNDAEDISKDLPESAQDQLNEATSQLQKVVDAAKEKADYSGLDEAIKEAEKIVNNPDDYTEESVKNAQDALDAAEALNKDLEKNDENQAIIDGVIQDLVDSATNAEKKADYAEFDKVVEDLENIVNNPDKFTDETVQAAKDALNDAEEVSKDLSESEQPTLDEITDSLKDVVDNAQNRADYTEYNKIKTEADNLVNDDGNGNPIYDEEAFQQYKDKVTEIDNGLNKNLDETQQSTVDEATQALKDLRTELDISSKEYDEIVIDPETKVDDTTVQDIVDEITKDLTENQGYAEDEIIVEFKDYTGKDLAGEAFVGTGSTMRVILKSTGELLEYKLFIVYGDVDGDGDIDGDDYQKSMNVGLKKETYAEEHSYFFTANDVIEDGVIDVLDCATIRRMM